MVMHMHVRTDKVVEVDTPKRRTVRELREILNKNGYDVAQSRTVLYDLRNRRRIVGRTDLYKPKDTDYIRFETEQVYAPYTAEETLRRIVPFIRFGAIG